MKRWAVYILILIIIAGCKKGGNPGDNSSGNGGATAKTPGKPALLSPAQNSVCITGRISSATESQVQLTWSAAANTDSYDLTVTNLLTTQSSTTSNIADVQSTVTLLQNAPYSWYVVAKQKSSTTTAKSDVWKFYNSGPGVTNYVPFPAEITSPTFGQIVTANNGTINLTWNGSSPGNNIKSYNVYFGTTIIPDLFKTGITDMFLNGIAVTSGKTYYWHVVTVDSNNNFSDSGLYQFTIQ